MRRASLLERVAYALRVLAEGCAVEDCDSQPAYIPAHNPLQDELGATQRNAAALGLMDDDCYGFLLLTVRREFHGPNALLRVEQHVDPSWWPAIAETLDRISIEARR